MKNKFFSLTEDKVKRIITSVCVLSFVLALGNYTKAENAEAPAGDNPAFTGDITGIDETDALQISDDNVMTSYTADRINLTVTSKDPFSSVYILWNSIPKKYSITAKDKTVEADDGFLHKLVRFETPVREFTLNCESGGELAEIYLFKGSDNYPEFVQDWSPPCKQADLFVLSTHADDEYLMFGGTIPYYAKERGLQVQVGYLTTHFQEQPRPHELLNGLWTAGVRNYPVLGVIGDIPYTPIYSLEEAASLYDFNRVLDWFVEQIRRFKPSVIVSHDVNGEYGHGAHMLAAKTVQDAVAISNDPDSFPDSAKKYGVWDVPKTYLHFWEENKIVMDWEQPLESFGGLTAREAAELAYSKHESQQKWGYIVGYWKQYDIRQFGLYRTLVGADEKPDFMDHIEPVEIYEETTVPETTPPETAPPKTTSLEVTTAAQTAAFEETTAVTAESDSRSPEEENSDNSIYLIIIFAAAAAALLTTSVIIITSKRKK